MTWNTYGRPPDEPASGPEGSTASAAQPAVASDADSQAKPGAADLKTELEAALVEAGEWKDRFLRKAAEFENFRKRSDKDRGEAVMLAKSSVLLEFLPVVDACERALRSFRDGDAQPGLEQYREGVALLYRQVIEVLGRLGVSPIDAEGQPFDPHLHEALASEERADHEENTIARELRRGYLFKGRLLRPAQVAVSTRQGSQEAQRS